MPHVWLEPDELKAMQDVFDWMNRIGQPLDWAAFDRAKARILNHRMKSEADCPETGDPAAAREE